MQHRRSHKLLALPIVAALALAACGSDEEGTADTAASATTAADSPTDTDAADTTVSGETTPSVGSSPVDSAAATSAVSLAGDCPETVTIQTDWMPEAEHGFLYQMVGEGYTVDTDKAAVVGPLVDGDGNETGVQIRIQSGGGAQNFQPVSSLMYQDDQILLGYVYTDEAIQYSATFPTVAIESGFEKNPQMIMWDPATYPDVKGIADLGKEGVKIRYFGGAAYMDYFVSTGILSKDQVDGSYSGDSSLFVADEGKAAQQGFGSAEPYLYEEELEGWKKPVAYEYINDVGWRNYAESIATKPENIETYAACFEKLVPIIQQASVDYITEPARANEVIMAAVEGFGGDFGWEYTEGSLEYGVRTIKEDGLVANGTDGVMGSFDMERVAELIEKAIPVYTEQGTPPKEGLKPEDIVTNQFLDESISL